jgi:predicted short-subunit dehydrogenase-like oxidoreductase (DUF2520 family)
LLTRKSEIVFIGAGKVAHTLIPLLIEKKYAVKAVVSSNKKTLALLVKKYKISFTSTSISEVPEGTQIIFLTVPDNQISIVAKKLSSLNLDFRNTLFIHTSGSENTLALNSLERKGGMTASFHIMQTFPSLKLTEIKNSFAAIETKNKSAEKFLFALADNLKLNAFKMNEESKVYYHLAGVFASNFLNANLYASEELLQKTGLNKKDYFNLFEPIVYQTITNIKNNGVDSSLSGPVERGDYQTVKKHLGAIKKLKGKSRFLFLQSYVSQSLILLEVIKMKNGELSSNHKKLKKVLGEGLKNINS